MYVSQCISLYMYICICISICLCCKWQQHQLMKWIAACLSKPDANWINPCLKWFAIPSSTKRSSSCFPHDASYKCKSLDPTGTGYGWALRCFPRKLQGHPGPIGGPCHLAQLWLEGRWAHPARTYARLSQHASRRDIGKLLVILGIRMYESHCVYIYVCMFVYVCLSMYLCICMSGYDVSLCISLCVSLYVLSVSLYIIYVSIHRSVCLSVSLSVCLSVRRSVCPSVRPSVSLSLCLSVDR